MSSRARKDMVGVMGERWCLNTYNGGDTQVVVLKKTRWRRQASSCARIDVAGVSSRLVVENEQARVSEWRASSKWLRLNRPGRGDG